MKFSIVSSTVQREREREREMSIAFIESNLADSRSKREGKTEFYREDYPRELTFPARISTRLGFDLCRDSEGKTILTMTLRFRSEKHPRVRRDTSHGKKRNRSRETMLSTRKRSRMEGKMKRGLWLNWSAIAIVLCTTGRWGTFLLAQPLPLADFSARVKTRLALPTWIVLSRDCISRLSDTRVCVCSVHSKKHSYVTVDTVEL